MTVMEAQQALVDALTPLTAEVADLTVYGHRAANATPPALDVYPGDPFQEGAGFGVGSKRVWFTVRARVNSADEQAQQLLLRMLDPQDAASVEAALTDADATVGNDGYVSGYRDDLDGLLSCEWRVSVYL